MIRAEENESRRRFVFATTTVLCGLLGAALSQPALAATHCVNPAGSSGCSLTIGGAIAASAPNDVINVAPGTYAEKVVVDKPLSLVGAGSDSTFINAQGVANGIYIDGLDNANLSGVLITGFTIMNANFEGILITNASYITISGNHVTNNDRSLDFKAGSCPGQPVFETNEGDDCGEGIHLVGADHVTVANNVVDLNSGGILLSDETGYTHDNLISGNTVRDNPYDCGITMASHAPSPQAASKLPYGVFNNTVTGNTSASNGLASAGGAGVGIFAPGPGNLAFGNKVIGNVIENNGMPGVAMHNHAAPPGAPGINLNDTVIADNFISGNGADVADAATPGPTGIDIYGVAGVWGTVVEGNTIANETVGVTMNNPGEMELHLNNLPAGSTGVLNRKGVVNATMNFWGCAGGAGGTGCATVSGGAVTSSPSLPAKVKPAPRGH